MDTTLADRVALVVSYSGVEASILSVLAGLAQSHVGQLAHGRVERPSAETLARIASVTGVDLTWLATGRGHPPWADDVAASVSAASERRVA